jgi:hypothetical protein
MLDAPEAVSSATGLSEVQAADRLKAEGYNELPRSDRRTPFRIVLEVLREPMLVLLLGGGLLYLLLGSPEEALILLAFALFSIVITVEPVAESLRACCWRAGRDAEEVGSAREGVEAASGGLPGPLLRMRPARPGTLDRVRV